jgi:hypothetical protein
MKTGTDVIRDGVYVSDCCLAERGLKKDALFPRCPKCLELTVWASAAVSSPPKLKKTA